MYSWASAGDAAAASKARPAATDRSSSLCTARTSIIGLPPRSTGAGDRTTGPEDIGAGTRAAAETGLRDGRRRLPARVPEASGIPGAAGSSAGGVTPAWPGFATTFAVRNTTSSRRTVSVRSFLNSQPSTGIFESQGIPFSSFWKASWRRPEITTVPPSSDVGLRDRSAGWRRLGAIKKGVVIRSLSTSSLTAIVSTMRPSPTTRGVTCRRVVTSWNVMDACCAPCTPMSC